METEEKNIFICELDIGAVDLRVSLDGDSRNKFSDDINNSNNGKQRKANALQDNDLMEDGD